MSPAHSLADADSISGSADFYFWNPPRSELTWMPCRPDLRLFAKSGQEARRLQASAGFPDAQAVLVIVMACIVMALHSYGLHSYGL